MSACIVCGDPVDEAALAGGFHTHPSCDWDEDARRRFEAQRADYIARSLLAVVAESDPAGMEAALLIIHRRAQHTAQFDINDLRAEFDAAGIPKPLRGPAFGRAAHKHRWIHKVGLVPSTGTTEHGKAVNVYRSLIRSA